MSLIELLDAYIDHQREMVTKSCQFDYKKAEDRMEIIDGLIKAYSILTELIEKIRKCNGKEGVKNMLKNDYGFTERQAEAIAMLPLYRLSNTDILALNKEKGDLTTEMERLNSILTNPNLLDKEIVTTLKEVGKKFAVPRKTVLLDAKQTFESVDQTKLIAKEDVYVALTTDGYAKRSSIKSYDSSAKANKDDPLNMPKMKPSDSLVFLKKCTTHDSILFFTDKGTYGYLPIYMLNDMKWKEEGKHLNNLVSLKANEKIVKAFLVNDFKEGINVCILTKENKVKRTPLKEFTQTTLTKKPLKACKLLNKDDRVVGVCLTSGNSDVLVTDIYGRTSRFNESDIPLVSTSAMGVKAIASGIDEAPLSSILSLTTKEVSLLLVLSNRRACRLINSAKIETRERLGAKDNLVKIFKSKPFEVIQVAKVNKVKGQNNYFSCVTMSGNVIIDLANLNPVDLNGEMRENIPDLGTQLIIGSNDLGEVVDDNFIIESPKPAKIVPTKATEDKADAQLSLFDLFEKGK